MKTKLTLPLGLISLFLWSAAFAQGTAFTYQGQLNDGVSPANGTYDLRFGLFDAVSAGTQLGNTQTNSATSLSNGLFTVTLDFGNQFPGAPRWLEIAVRTNGEPSFTVLNPRQKLTATPYAITASNITGIVGGTSLSGTYSSAVTFNNAVNSFSGNGGGLTGLNANNLASGTVPAAALNNAWKIAGNSGTTPGTHFVGTTDNQSLDFRVNNRRAVRLQPNTNGAPTFIAGSSSNVVSANVPGAAIGGGDQNFIQSFPFATSDFAAISGGSSNLIDYFSFNAAIAGGFQNTVGPNSYYSIIGGGLQNRMDYGAAYSAIVSGQSNSLDVFARYSVIGGGEANSIGYLGLYSTVGGGKNNTIRSNAQYAVITGGTDNLIQTNAQYSTISGGTDNQIGRDVTQSSIGGGGANAIYGRTSVIAGGSGNTIETNAYESAIGGGFGNRIQAEANRSTISGGSFHDVSPAAHNAFVGGGTRHKVSTNSDHSTIAGGSNNTIDHDAEYGFIGGGKLHTIAPQSAHAVIAGGDGNIASGEAPAIGGGTLNEIQPGTTYSTIVGGGGNLIGANSFGSTIAGGYLNQITGNFGFAAGNQAQVNHPGTFAWAGGNTMPYASIFPNSVNLYASNGVSMDYGPQSAGQPRGSRYVYIGPINAGNTISTWNGARLTDGGVWSNASDRNRKTDFREINPRAVLETLAVLPVREWRYTNEDASVKHLGPVAQEFRAAFGLGTDDKSIGTIDADGVALAAILGLIPKVEEQRTELKQKETEITDLKQRLDALEKLLLSQKSN